MHQTGGKNIQFISQKKLYEKHSFHYKSNSDVKHLSTAFKTEQGSCIGSVLFCLRTNRKMKNKKREIQVKMLKKIFHNFASNTTAHGFQFVISTKRWYVKSFWLLVISASFAMFCYQAKKLVIQYLDVPIMTKTYIEEAGLQHFPLVAVCNRNAITKQQFPELLRTDAFKEKKNLLKGLNGKDKLKNKLQSFYRFYQGTNMIIAHNGTSIYQYGHSFNDTIQSCVYSEITNCKTKQYWRQFWHWKFGNCFAFNSDIDGKGEKRKILQAQVGINNALKLTIKINRDEYLPWLADSIGAVLHVSPQGKDVDLLYHGVSLQPGKVHYAGIEKYKRIRVDKFKNNSCIEDYVSIQPPIKAQQKITKHSKVQCRDNCFQRRYELLCNCTVDVRHAVFYPICAHEHVECMVNVSILLKEESCFSACMAPCKEINYPVELTYGDYNDHNEHDLRKDDVLDLYVYFKTFEVKVIEDQLYYTWGNLLADIGGHMGLWCGYSWLTVVEFVSLFAIVISRSVKLLF